VPLGDYSPEAFLNTYWQKKPLVIRDAVPDFSSPLAPEELAGLACDEGVESRIILKEGGNYPWELRQGPFQEDDFLNLPETHWTVLVQEVDRLIPEVGALLDRFRFIPDWRIDDVMVSYAPDGGTVGPHIDNYDVFLLQGLGEREWRIGHEPVQDETIVPDLDIRILDDFTPDETVTLGSGDMLYLPPRVAHHGIARGDCMTYSIGFRAPSYRQLLGDFLGYAMEQVDADARYSDPDLEPTSRPGEIQRAAREKVRAILRSAVANDRELDRWFGRFITRPQRDRYALPLEDPYRPDELADAIQQGARLRRGAATRTAFFEHADGTVSLFFNGEERMLQPKLSFAGPLLTGREVVPAGALAPYLDEANFVGLLTELVNDGLFDVEPPAHDVAPEAADTAARPADAPAADNDPAPEGVSSADGEDGAMADAEVPSRETADSSPESAASETSG
jgi:50S ribosomal protein L16 3-hydroxylase